MTVAPPINRVSKRRSGFRGRVGASAARPLPVIGIDEAKRHDMSLSEQILQKEDLRSRLFGEVWRTLIPEVFRDVPTYYDQGNAVASLGSCSRWSATFARAIDKHLPHGAEVLDVCSGTHDIPLRLLALDPTLRIHAVDGSAHMTAEGQRRAHERNLTIHARVCDAHVLPFPDNSFDAVTLQFASRHLEVVKSFREIYRVLKPGGIFCHNDMLRPSSRVVEAPYLAYLRFSVWFTALLFGSSAESRKCVGYFAKAIRHFYKPGELSELLEGLGFHNIESRNFLTGVMSYHIARKPT